MRYCNCSSVSTGIAYKSFLSFHPRYRAPPLLLSLHVVSISHPFSLEIEMLTSLAHSDAMHQIKEKLHTPPIFFVSTLSIGNFTFSYFSRLFLSQNLSSQMIAQTYFCLHIKILYSLHLSLF